MSEDRNKMDQSDVIIESGGNPPPELEGTTVQTSESNANESESVINNIEVRLSPEIKEKAIPQPNADPNSNAPESVINNIEVMVFPEIKEKAIPQPNADPNLNAPEMELYYELVKEPGLLPNGEESWVISGGRLFPKIPTKPTPQLILDPNLTLSEFIRNKLGKGPLPKKRKKTPTASNKRKGVNKSEDPASKIPKINIPLTYDLLQQEIASRIQRIKAQIKNDATIYNFLQLEAKFKAKCAGEMYKEKKYRTRAAQETYKERQLTNQKIEIEIQIKKKQLQDLVKKQQT